MRKLSLALAALLLLTSEAAASKSCPTKSEAKTAHKGAYLYWQKNAEGQRCWSNRRPAKHTRHARRSSYVVEDVPTRVEPPPSKPMPVIYPLMLRFPPDQTPNPPHDVMTMLPIPPEAISKQPIRDFAPWQWTTDAFAATPPAPEAAPPPRTPTVVNRDLKGPKTPTTAARYTADMVMVLLVVWLLCLMIGGTLYRWAKQRDELKLERGHQ